MAKFEELQPIVEGIARQYSKDLVLGKGFDFQKYDDLKQELWVKAYEILKDNPDASVEFIAKCLWNKVTDLWRKSVKEEVNEELHAQDDFTGSQITEDSVQNNSLLDCISKISESVNSKVEEDSDEFNEAVKVILNKAKAVNDNVYKYVVVKLKLSCYLPESFEPTITVSTVGQFNSESTEDGQVLSELFHFSNAKTGGSGSWKSKKSQLRSELLNEFDLEESYLSWYEVTFRTAQGTDSQWIKAYNRTDAVDKFYKKTKLSADLVEIISVVEE